MNEQQKPIFTTDKEYQINIISALLKENNIKFNIINKQDSMYKFGNIELYVEPEDIEKAKQIVKEAEL